MKILITLLLCFGILSVAGQIQMKSFRKLDNDMSARTLAKKDQNGDVCAIIKVVVPEKGFLFEGDGNGIVAVEEKTGEYWIYLPYGSRFLTIKHNNLGVLRAQPYNMKIEGACVYEMVLTTARVRTVIEETVNGQYLILTVEPQDATIYIDDNYIVSKNGMVNMLLPFGKHTYRIERSPYFHTEAGSFDVQGEQRIEKHIKLQEAFGKLEITSTPEEKAEVYIDGERVGETPYTGEKLVSGEHSIRILKNMFRPHEAQVTIRDGETATYEATLIPTFAMVTLKTDQGSVIYINNERKAQGEWKGRLNTGMYEIEVRKESHRTIKKSLEIAAGEERTEQLGNPEPIYGTLNVNTIPAGATIKLNEKDYGTGPQIIKNVLVGKYLMEVSMSGWTSDEQEIEVQEGKVSNFTVELQQGYSITIVGDPDADIYLDGKMVGTTKVILKLKPGVYLANQEHDIWGRTEKEIVVSQDHETFSIVKTRQNNTLQQNSHPILSPKPKPSTPPVSSKNYKLGETIEGGTVFEVNGSEAKIFKVLNNWQGKSYENAKSLCTSFGSGWTMVSEYEISSIAKNYKKNLGISVWLSNGSIYDITTGTIKKNIAKHSALLVVAVKVLRK